MDDHISWKTVYLGAIFSLLVLFFAYFFIAPYSPPQTQEKGNNLGEISNVRYEGKKEGKKLWEVIAKAAWKKKGEDVVHLTGITDGKIYNDKEKLAITGLFSSFADIQEQATFVLVFENDKDKRIKAKFNMQNGNENNNSKPDWMTVNAKSAKYSFSDKKSELSDNVRLTKKNLTINAGYAAVFLDTGRMDITKEVLVSRSDGFAKSDTAQYLRDNKQLNMLGKVSMQIKGKKDKTEIKCNQAEIYDDPDKNVSFMGSVEAIQGKKASVGETGLYSKNSKEFTLVGKTKTVIEKAGEMLKKDTAAKLRNRDAKNILKEKTILTASSITFSTSDGDATAAGSVEVFQKEKEAKSDQANYDEKEEILSLTGNVFLKKGNEWIRCKQVIISIKDETFEALGVTDSKITF